MAKTHKEHDWFHCKCKVCDLVKDADHKWSLKGVCAACDGSGTGSMGMDWADDCTMCDGTGGRRYQCEVCHKETDKRPDAAFGGPEQPGESTFYERYFSSRGVPAEVAIKVGRILEEELGVDLSRLAAEDELIGDLSLITEYNLLDSVEVMMRIEEECYVEISENEAEQSTSIEGIVNLVWNKLGLRGA